MTRTGNCSAPACLLQCALLTDAEAVRLYRKAIALGHVYALCNLGCMYEEGRGVKQSYKEAAKWYRKAAERGNAIAQCNLGEAYEKGRGVKQSIQEAIKWYRKAAEQGDADAQAHLDRLSNAQHDTRA